MMQVNSSISNSENHSKNCGKNPGKKKRIKIAAAIVLFLAILLALNKFLGWILTDDQDRLTRVTIHDMYTSEENIDVVFVGSSHALRSMDTDILDDVLDQNTFVLGTSGQRINGSYALLKEAFKTNDIQTVYLESYYETVRTNSVHFEGTSVYIISDYLKPSLNKFSLLCSITTSDNVVNNFFPARRYWSNIFDADSTYLRDQIGYKFSESYRDYEIADLESSEYVKKGHFIFTSHIENENFSAEGHYKSIADGLFEDTFQIQYLKKIITFCEENDIELVLYSSPMPDFRLADLENYDSYIEQVNKVCEEYNLSYYDFNLMKEDFFSGDSSYFADDNHLSAEGSELFSEIFGKFFTGQIDEEDLFYDSYNEKLKESSPKMYGIVYKIKEVKDQKKIRITPVTNDEEGTYYYVISKKTEESDEYVEFLSFTDPEPIFVDKEESGTMKVEIYSDPELQNRTNEITFSY